MNTKKLGKLLVSIILTQGAGLLGSVATFTSVNTWFKTLVRSPISPPDWVFGPVWTVLYILMGAALYLIWDKGFKNKRVKFAFWLFIVHLAFNVGWSVVFFGMQSLFGGFVVLLVLWMFIIALIWKFFRIDRWAAFLLVPYFLWVSFAGVLNVSLWLLNR